MEGPAVHATAPRQPRPLPSSLWPPEPSWRAGQAQGRTDLQAEPQFLHVQCSPHHLPAVDGGGGGELVPEEARCAQRMPLASCLGKASTRNGALASLPPRRAEAPPLTRSLVLGWACGADVVLTNAGPVGLLGVRPTTPAKSQLPPSRAHGSSSWCPVPATAMQLRAY